MRWSFAAEGGGPFVREDKTLNACCERFHHAVIDFITTAFPWLTRLLDWMERALTPRKEPRP